MPLLRLSLTGPLPDTNPTAPLQAALTHLMAQVLGKQAGLTVVQVLHTAHPAGTPNTWACHGVALGAQDWAASLEVFITAGTNTPAEVAAFIAQAHALICSHWAQPPAAPLYIVVHPVDAAMWGYNGATQRSRHQAPAAG
jgi:4-oxalocrotonate tautomerase